MAIANGSFETQASGSGPGVADSWTVTEHYTAEEYAEVTNDFYANIFSSKETFDSEWPLDFVSGLIGAFQGLLDDLTPAFYGSSALDAEGFDVEWGSLPIMGPFDYSTLPLDFAGFDAAGQDVEDFEEWPTIDDELNGGFTAGELLFAAFDTNTETVEDFEEAWRGNESYIDAFVGPGTDLTLATFSTGYGASGTVETFEGASFDLSGVVFDPSTDVWTSVGHDLGDTWKVTLRNSGGRLPDGFLLETEYYARNTTSDTFQLSATSTGAIIDGSDTGYGTHSVRHDTRWWWTEELTGV